uniref:Uncharacterized protein n=1 Tax=Athene cunicularia TaxID=194338 RepID=A0A663MFW1_ATHCN
MHFMKQAPKETVTEVVRAWVSEDRKHASIFFLFTLKHNPHLLFTSYLALRCPAQELHMLPGTSYSSIQAKGSAGTSDLVCNKAADRFYHLLTFPDLYGFTSNLHQLSTFLP